MAEAGKRLKLLRTELGLKQGEMAARMGISQSALSDFERGFKGIAERYIKLICLEFEVNDTWLRVGKGNMFIEKPEPQPRLLDAEGKNLDRDEAELISIYRELLPESKKFIHLNINTMLTMQKASNTHPDTE